MIITMISPIFTMISHDHHDDLADLRDDLA
jgi:hypothetical protein